MTVKVQVSIFVSICIIMFITLLFTIGQMVEEDYRNYNVHDLVPEAEEQYICDNVLVYKYYISMNEIIDAEKGREYDLFKDCKKER